MKNNKRRDFVDSQRHTETEEKYIEQMSMFVASLNRGDDEKFNRLKKELREDMEIKDSYHPFD